VASLSTYLLARDINQDAAAGFMSSLSEADLTPENPTREDYIRCGDLLRQYSDASLDFVDAPIVAMSERLNIACILTLDRRDFQIVRPKHCSSFELLP
jgi:predicted nucleic acid-binding protein